MDIWSMGLRSVTLSRLYAAEHMQPWRCVTCGEAVAPVGYPKRDCACTRALKEVPHAR